MQLDIYNFSKALLRYLNPEEEEGVLNLIVKDAMAGMRMDEVFDNKYEGEKDTEILGYVQSISEKMKSMTLKSKVFFVSTTPSLEDETKSTISIYSNLRYEELKHVKEVVDREINNLEKLIEDAKQGN